MQRALSEVDIGKKSLKLQVFSSLSPRDRRSPCTHWGNGAGQLARGVVRGNRHQDWTQEEPVQGMEHSR